MIINQLCREDIDADDPEVRSFLAGEGLDAEAFIDGLIATTLVARNGRLLTLTTEECACVTLPDGRRIGGENNTGRVTPWVGRFMEQRRSELPKLLATARSASCRDGNVRSATASPRNLPFHCRPTVSRADEPRRRRRCRDLRYLVAAQREIILEGHAKFTHFGAWQARAAEARACKSSRVTANLSSARCSVGVCRSVPCFGNRTWETPKS